MRAPLEPTAEEYDLLLQATAERRRLAATYGDGESESDDGWSVGCDDSSREADERRCTHLIITDLSRTFPALGIFREGGCMRSQLQELLFAYNGFAYGGCRS